MPFPPSAQVELAILRVIAQMGGQARPQDVYPRVTERLKGQLTQEDLSRTVKSGDNAWTNSIQFTRQRLIKKGELDGKTYGVWRITDKGRQRVGVAPTPPAPPPAVSRPPRDEVTQLVDRAKSALEELSELAKKAELKTPPLAHDALVQIAKEMGQLLGRNVEPVANALYRHDCVWKENPWQTPRLVVEICDKGILDKDITSLGWAMRNWGAKGILVIVDDSDFLSAQRKLTGESDIYLLRATSFVQLHSLMKEGYVQVLKTLFGL